MSRSLAKLFFLVLVAAGSIHAQTPTGTIAGVVTDPTGAPVAGARVNIINHDSGLTAASTPPRKAITARRRCLRAFTG